MSRQRRKRSRAGTGADAAILEIVIGKIAVGIIPEMLQHRRASLRGALRKYSGICVATRGYRRFKPEQEGIQVNRCDCGCTD